MKPRARRRPGAGGWLFLTSHSLVLAYLADHPRARVREMAEAIGISERRVQSVLADLVAEGYLARARQGRRTVYTLDPTRPLRHTLEQHRVIGSLLGLEQRPWIEGMLRVARHLASETDRDRVLTEVLGEALRATRAETGTVYRWDERLGALHVVHTTTPHPFRLETVPLGQGAVGQAAQERRPVVIHDYQRQENMVPAALAAGVQAALGVPLLHEGRLLGALVVSSLTEGHRFTSGDQDLLELLAGLASAVLAGLERAQLESAMRFEAERDRLRQVLDVLPEGVGICDEQGVLLLANQAAQAILGRDLTGGHLPLDDEAAGREVYGVRHLDGTPYTLAEVPLHRSARAGEVVLGEQVLVRHATADRDVPLLVNSAPLRDPAGRLTGAVAVFQDISALHDLDRQRDEFLAAAAHDLRNPLTTIRGYAQLLRQACQRGQALSAARLERGLAEIEAGTSQMMALVDELLDLARLQMGQPLELDRQPTDLVALAGAVIARCQATAPSHTLRLEASSPEVVGQWDAARLERALANLVGNAVKYSPSGGAVVVRVERQRAPHGDEAVLTVQDEGIGIPAQDLPFVFERFRRGRNVIGQIGGSGIGLANVRQVAEQHGGSVSVASQEGAGATFTLRLPLGERTAADEHERRGGSRGPEGHRDLARRGW